MKTILWAACCGILASATDALAQPATPRPSGGRCAPDQTEVYAPGCEGAPRVLCVGSISLPVVSTWCGCDGRAVQSASNNPPAGTRYRFEGVCDIDVRLRVQPEPGPRGAPDGQTVRPGR